MEVQVSTKEKEQVKKAPILKVTSKPFKPPTNKTTLSASVATPFAPSAAKQTRPPMANPNGIQYTTPPPMPKYSYNATQSSLSSSTMEKPVPSFSTHNTAQADNKPTTSGKSFHSSTLHKNVSEFKPGKGLSSSTMQPPTSETKPTSQGLKATSKDFFPSFYNNPVDLKKSSLKGGLKMGGRTFIPKSLMKTVDPTNRPIGLGTQNNREVSVYSKKSRHDIFVSWK